MTIDSLFLRRRFIFLLFALIAKFAFGASPDFKASDEEGKEGPTAQENKAERDDKGGKEAKKEETEKAEKGDLQPPPPVTTEHAVTLPGGKTLSYKTITGYLLLRDTKEDARAAAESEKDPGKQNAQRDNAPAREHRNLAHLPDFTPKPAWLTAI